MTLSSCEAEYMVACAESCQEIWLRDLLVEITESQMLEVVIKVDYTSAITLAKNPVFHGRSKHTNSHYHYIRE